MGEQNPTFKSWIDLKVGFNELCILPLCKYHWNITIRFHFFLFSWFLWVFMSCQKVALESSSKESRFYSRLVNCDRAISVGDDGDFSEFEPPNPLEMIDLSWKAPMCLMTSHVSKQPFGEETQERHVSWWVQGWFGTIWLQLVKINYKDCNDMGRIVSNGLYYTVDVITHGVYIFYTMWMWLHIMHNTIFLNSGYSSSKTVASQDKAIVTVFPLLTLGMDAIVLHPIELNLLSLSAYQ